VVEAALARVQSTLTKLTEDGQGEHLIETAPVTERQSLESNLKKFGLLHTQERKAALDLTEAKSRLGSGGASCQPHAVTALAEKLEKLRADKEVIGGIIERQKTIPGLWHCATSTFNRVKAEEAQLISQLKMLKV